MTYDVNECEDESNDHVIYPPRTLHFGSEMCFILVILLHFRTSSSLFITTRNDQNCALQYSETKCWGLNNYGQLGYGDTNNRGDTVNEMGNGLLDIDFGSNFIPSQISIGVYHTCALSTTNKAKCFGRNRYGQLGYGDTTQRGDKPDDMSDNLLDIVLGSDFTPIQITAGSAHTCALSTMNKVKCFGHNSRGQLGYGDSIDRGSGSGEMGDNLQEVDLGSNFIPMHIVAGSFHTCALSTSGAVKCWGRNNHGQLGYGDTDKRGDEPDEMGDKLLDVELGSNFTPIDIVAGSFHTCSLSASGAVKCWGRNNHGQLGYGDTDKRGDEPDEMGDKLLDVELGSNFTPIDIVAGSFHTCSLSASGAVKCWGRNGYDELGYGDTNRRGNGPNEMGDNLKEIDLGTSFIAMQVTAGEFHTCALSRANEVKCWGLNVHGQLGYYGDRSVIGVPEVDLGSNFIPIQIMCGAYHTCALSSSNKVKCFGLNDKGQLGYGDTNSRGDGLNEMGDMLPEIDLGSSFTSHPTTLPTFAPTFVPLVLPTIGPSFVPTWTPTVRPTWNPSIAPAEWLTAQVPTENLREGKVHEITTLTTAITESFQPNGDNQSVSSYWTMVVVILSCIICVAAGWIYYLKIHKAKEGSKQAQRSAINAVNVVEENVIPDKPAVSAVVLQIPHTDTRERVYTESQYSENDDDEKVDTDSMDIIPGSVAETDGADTYEKQCDLLREWLTKEVKLDQYYDALVDNGYETLDIVKEITKEEELREIGIVLNGHVLKLMKEIGKLKVILAPQLHIATKL
eukprot:198083_1